MTLTSLWYRRSWTRWLLWPLSLLYQTVSRLHKWTYSSGIRSRYRAPVPVLIVGNISVGGSGKTPLVIALVKLLRKQGYHPGVVSRGYKAATLDTPAEVTTLSGAADVGDEPLLIYERTGAPVYVFPRRQAAIEQMLDKHNVDIVLCDDGLQHFAIHRDIEIAVVDAQRLHGNELCLPAGPLREPVARLKSVDFTVYNGSHNSKYFYTSTIGHLVSLTEASDTPGHSPENASAETQYQPVAISELAGQTVRAVAGIGHPQRFFDLLRQHGLNVIEHPFADHYKFTAQDLQFADNKSVIMTEKDAVKCRALDIDLSRYWFTRLDVSLSDHLKQDLLARLISLGISELSKTDREPY